MTNSDAAFSKGFHAEWHEAIARSDRTWDRYQTARVEHGDAASDTSAARDAFIAATKAELAAYDLFKGNS